MNDIDRAIALIRGWGGDPAVLRIKIANEFAAIRAETKAECEREIRDALSLRLNNHLVDMQEDYDDSIVGFNEAWDIVSKYFDWLAANRPSPK